MSRVLGILSILAGGAVFAVSLASDGSAAYRVPLAVGLLVLIVSTIMIFTRAPLQSADLAGGGGNPPRSPKHAAFFLASIAALPLALAVRLPFGVVAFVFLWAGSTVLHPVPRRGAMIGFAISLVIGFGAVMIFRDILNVDLE